MCVIGYAPRNATIDDKTIEVMFENNPDGAGIMWKDGNKPVEIRKGFFDVKALLSAWHKIPLEAEKAIHCRIATAGKINSQCCHPFPVRETTGSMKERSTNTDMAFMHNGIIRMTQPPQGIKSPYSDTMMFGKEVLYPVKNALSYPYVQELVENGISGSRLLIFSQYGETIKLGDWVKDGKCYFSNSSYKSYKYYNTGTTIYSYGNSVNLPVKSEVKAKDAVVVPVEEDWDNLYTGIENNIYDLLDNGCGKYIEDDVKDLTDCEFISTYGCTKRECKKILDDYDKYYGDDYATVESVIAEELKKEGEQVAAQ